MARKARDQQTEETEGTAIYSSPQTMIGVDDVDDSAPLVNQSMLGTSAVLRDGNAAIDAPKPMTYMVLREQWIMGRGGRTILRQGKVIDSLNYDIESLRSQGVELREFG